MNVFFGPMSKNIVDTIIDFSLQNTIFSVVLIPSRRQIDYCGGYVNNWNTSEFYKYVKSKNPNILIERDHGGACQGSVNDDGYESLREDCKYMDIIHIDPWKKHHDLHEGIKKTIEMIEYCYNLNPELQYEIGTEENIRFMSEDDLDVLVSMLKSKLETRVFNKIKYLVIQCGTALQEHHNTGVFNKQRLLNMISICKKYNLIPKEHNGDYITSDIHWEKYKLGLNNVNVAPELATTETSIILEHINNEDFEILYELCYLSGKWKKWVSQSFIPEENKKKLVLISCHYVYSTPEFQRIIEKYTDIVPKIKEAIYDKILYLINTYTRVKKCLFCNTMEFDTLFKNDYLTGLTCNFYTQLHKSHFMPFNILICKKCKSSSLKYLGNPNIIYETNHADAYGKTKELWSNSFKTFITENKNISGIIEVGACTDALGSLILDQLDCNYTIIDPDYKGTDKRINSIRSFLELVNINNIQANSIVMSNVFEHFYNPLQILEKIKDSNNIKYIYLNHPDFEYAIAHNTLIVLNHEHIWYIEHDVLFKLFENYGFYLNKRYDLNNQLIQLEFVRKETCASNLILNKNSYMNIRNYFYKQFHIVNSINNILIHNTHTKYYIWPAAIYTTSLFTLGLRYDLLNGILDNSPNKINKYITNYNLYCTSLDELLKNDPENTCVIISGVGNYLKEIDFSNKNTKLMFINDLNMTS